MNWWWLIAGPLAGPECRRLLSRRWLPLVRTLVALPALGTLLAITWFWWTWKRLTPDFDGSGLLGFTVAALTGIAIAAALLIAPALLAGTLAGDKDRGTLLMLLTSRVSSWEIVAGRLVSRMCLLGVLLAAALPALMLAAGLQARPLAHLAVLTALPASVALGGSGLALAASALARRGRDALLAVYLFDVLLLIVPPVLGDILGGAWAIWLAPLNPFWGLRPLVDSPPALGPAVWTILLWTLLGLASSAFAAWRLTPVYLKQLDGSRRTLRFRRRPALATDSERPLLWKELYAERGARLSGIVRFAGGLLIAIVVAICLALAGVTAWLTFVDDSDANALWIAGTLREAVATTARPLSWLLQWAIGLRAAVTIAGERERDTWDVLLSTPLEGRDVVWSKLAGSLYALRGLAAVAILCWIVGLAGEAFGAAYFWELLATTAVVGTYMAAVGVLASVSCSTATRAMTVTITLWLASAVAVALLAGMLWSGVMFALMYDWFIEIGTGQMGGAGPRPPPLSGSFAAGLWLTIRLALFALGAILVGGYCRRNFDSLAGRAYPRQPPEWEPMAPEAAAANADETAAHFGSGASSGAQPYLAAATAPSVGSATNGSGGNG